MNYSKWASENRHRLGIIASEPDKKEIVEMDDGTRDKAIRGLMSKAEANNTGAADAEKQRADAVALLAGKRRAGRPVRDGVNQLLGRDR